MVRPRVRPWVREMVAKSMVEPTVVEPVSLLNTELGYPCYVTSAESWTEKTVGYSGRDVRAYMNLVATTILVLLGIETLVARYKGQRAPLVQVIRRDGGIHYLSLIDIFKTWPKVIRMVSVIIWTPAVIPTLEIYAGPLVMLLMRTNDVVIPILAQRLLINMRKVDYMGSEPIASKLLFTPPAPGSEDDLEGAKVSLEMTQEPSGLRQ
ncbi:hypothetical protein FA13DRAFT_1711638 [Coprinellus micaceus]|uniref:Uncharacterized protein n=1 Tax=Coprinellus micaceus TaxID=71717 RepID=A0A4Y7T363_COPMI|nr:hypothetical protein FA13DRAFT_1711638 [Coprinellus micaceus]